MRAIEFITEEFAAAFINRLKLTSEVMINPTLKELRETSSKSGSSYETGVFLHGPNMYTFDRYGVLHGEVAPHIPGFDNTFLPIYMYWNRTHAVLDITDSSRRSVWHHSPKAYDYVMSHPWLNKLFKEIEVSYYDEDIYGDWRDIDADQ